eukprot:CAMPEP_0170546968 /NCGR_PEP_ID=MMETSP0211-20121228/5343_1 /TAXON_ID=311385 /ORGANISM="Pseudokeronopsis sp., Strain OXSARD2" /LENGTH=78 /DNA_ID=CAMNT_0010851715 /DNA_START=323 /DNA_END=555 /DNA_ORIENTATION=+
MARDLGRYGVRAVAIAPGLFATQMTQHAIDNEKALKLAMKDIPLERVGDAEDFALLAKNVVENSYLTGSILRLNGGAV